MGLRCRKLLFVFRIIKVSSRDVAVSASIVASFRARGPLGGRQAHGTAPLTDSLDFIVLLCGAAVHFYESFLLSVQGRPGRQGFPGLTGPDGLKVRPGSRASAAETAVVLN